MLYNYQINSALSCETKLPDDNIKTPDVTTQFKGKRS